MAILKKVFNFGKQEYILETGRLACQADGSVLVKIQDLVMLVTVLYKKKKKQI